MLLHVAAGLLLCLLTWLALRLMVGAPLTGEAGRDRILPLLLDGFPVFAGFVLFVLPTARPIMAGLGIATLGLGLAIADRVKRRVLKEPVLFADRAELLEVVRHPRLYLSFVGVIPMALATLGCAAVIIGLLKLEPPLWSMGLLAAGGLALIGIVVGRLLFVLPGRSFLLSRLARCYERLAPDRDPAADARRFGLLATCMIHATLAKFERPARQRAAQSRSWPKLPADAGPIVIVQGESFVDASRLHPDLTDLLPHYAALKQEAVWHGLLEVPCWGANTIRSELAVLAGLGPEAIGLDRYNPYEHFARVPLPTLASMAREAGYRTVCLHPYTADFYGRDKVMPLLGFDEFIGIEGFAGAPRSGHYVSDVAVAERVAEIIRQNGSKTFVFAITMENHGPWDAAHDAIAPVPLPSAWRSLKEAPAIARWLAHLRSTDAMIPILRSGIGSKGCLVFYGDHQPSLQGAFDREDQRSDYAIWSPEYPFKKNRDLKAENIWGAVLQTFAKA